MLNFEGPYMTGLRPRLLTLRPYPYGKQTAARAMALLWLVGGATTLLVVVLPHPPALHRGVMLVIGLTAPVVAGVIYRLREVLPRGVYPWLLGTGSGITTVLVAAGGGGSASVSLSFFYIWVVIFAVLFFPPVIAAVEIAIAAVAYGAVMVWTGSFTSGTFTAVEPTVLGAVIATSCAVILLLSHAREASEIDPLTGIANRRGLDRVLAMAMEQAALHEDPLVVAIIDIDHFKQINDQHGHGAGDSILQEIVEGWTRVVRAGDTIARFGGDEFVLVLPECSLLEADAILERLRLVAPDGISCSLGSARFWPGDSASLLISRADAALYTAKRLGRDQLSWANEYPPAAADVLAVDHPWSTQ
ncbi:GGDEF domain-containing protein [Nitriliruptor alkaliphilus]|uniref:GGDEF domain-containing protein n=1 Tax=Nitriliruptor alkaliphilus TaxID=427918 RepID=UPI001B805C8A|nr:GGDEF domain-containing protein [Nitriliruptor alkaliphilus]